MRTVNLQNGSIGIISITTIIAASIVLLITITELGNFGIAHGQVNSTSLTPEQKAAICDPNNPSSRLNPVNTTESKICGIPVTLKPHPSNATTASSPNITTGGEAPPSTSTSPSPSPPPPATSIAPEAAHPS